MLAKTHERVEAMARMDYRTADYWAAQDARRDRLDDMVVANTLRRPPGCPRRPWPAWTRCCGTLRTPSPPPAGSSRSTRESSWVRSTGSRRASTS
ncbi:hypothetical protein ACFQ0M_15490 [Kitasatospora aburaviensis]